MTEYSQEEELLIEDTDCNDSVSLYKLFFTDNTLEMIVEETNKYAVQCLENSASNSREHQLDWKPVTKDEMNSFMGILLIMGLVLLPKIRLYWSRNVLYSNACIRKAMKRGQFISILKYLHFSDNSTTTTEDRLCKLRNIVDAIVHTFKNTIKPGKNFVIDETVIPWRRRL